MIFITIEEITNTKNKENIITITAAGTAVLSGICLITQSARTPAKKKENPSLKLLRSSLSAVLIFISPFSLVFIPIFIIFEQCGDLEEHKRGDRYDKRISRPGLAVEHIEFSVIGEMDTKRIGQGIPHNVEPYQAQNEDPQEKAVKAILIVLMILPIVTHSVFSIIFYLKLYHFNPIM